MNIWNGAGRLGRDAELRESNGKSVANFVLAVDERRGGEKVTLWIDCAIWGERAEKLAQYLTKGSAVAVSGRIGLRLYETRDGKSAAALTLMVNEITLLGGGERHEAPREQPREQPRQQQSGSDWKQNAQTEPLNDTIPF